MIELFRKSSQIGFNLFRRRRRLCRRHCHCRRVVSVIDVGIVLAVVVDVVNNDVVVVVVIVFF